MSDTPFARAHPSARFLGRSDGGTPPPGLHRLGDYFFDGTTPGYWVCSVPGAPGTFVNLLAAGGGLPSGGTVGDVVTNTAPGEGDWAAPSGTTVQGAVELEMNNPTAPINSPAHVPLVWDTFYSVVDNSASGVFPNDLGLTLDLATGLFTATVAGRWLAEATGIFESDATAVLRLTAYAVTPGANSGELLGEFEADASSTLRQLSVTKTIDRQIGQTFEFRASRRVGPTTDPYAPLTYAVGKITRLA